MCAEMPNNELADSGERQLQRALFRALSEPSVVRKTLRGRRLQILSPGRWNRNEGPDFLESAILLDGDVCIGSCEFHRDGADWERHGHSTDDNYNDVILHIVVSPSALAGSHPFETLVVPIGELSLFMNEEVRTATLDYETADELQHFALVRLLRKTANASELGRINGNEGALRLLIADFVMKYLARRKRPVYTELELGELITKLPQTQMGQFIAELADGRQTHIPDRMHLLVKEPLAGEGAQMRREILLNCVLPLALAIAREEARISLFLWYWSTPSLGSYGVLKNRFPQLPQNFLWQQQGMLEYVKEHGKKENVTPSSLKNYGFSEMLSFYKTGRSPFME
jgi:hypothetical protein